jgi:hydroxylamine reductase
VAGGKHETAAQLKDRLTGAIIFLGWAALRKTPSVYTDQLVLEGLFGTLSNVNFDDTFIEKLIIRIRQERIKIFPNSAGCKDFDLSRIWQAPNDIRSLKFFLLFGIRGIATYAFQACVLGYMDSEISSFIYIAMDALSRDDFGMRELLPFLTETGRINMKAMELLDRANTECFGKPELESVSMTVEKGPFIVIRGHDLGTLKLLLEQSAGKGVNIYTHGEMLPAHGYPELKKYPHLKGNFGSPWYNQSKEFEDIPAPVLFTSNCLAPVKDICRDRIFATATASCPGAIRIGADKDFSPLIAKALELGGYKEDMPPRIVNGGAKAQAGFVRHTMSSLANKLTTAVKAGDIKHIFLVSGCDGAKSGKNYYTDFAKRTPEDSLILTLGCVKHRFSGLDLGKVAGLPRILDIGQRNDAYSAIRTTFTLSEAFHCPVNKLPLSLVLSWYEQEAVGILLTLLQFGIKNIYLGPGLPDFVSPVILNRLMDYISMIPENTQWADLVRVSVTKSLY